MATSVQEMIAEAQAVVPGVTPAEAAELMQQGALVVDVRDGTEVAASGRVKGAVAVARGMLEFRADPAAPTHDPAFQPERTTILNCGSGGRAALAGKTLKDLGFRDVRNLGGLKDWVGFGGEIER
jgi:rhodanese-related sulfurtransferase